MNEIVDSMGKYKTAIEELIRMGFIAVNDFISLNDNEKKKFTLTKYDKFKFKGFFSKD